MGEYERKASSAEVHWLEFSFLVVRLTAASKTNMHASESRYLIDSRPIPLITTLAQIK